MNRCDAISKMARALYKLLRDEGGWHSTGKLMGLAAAHDLLDGLDYPRSAVETALTLLYSYDHVAHRSAHNGEWAVTTHCTPLAVERELIRVGPSDV